MPSGSTLFEQAETPAFALLLVSGSVELLAVRGAEETLVEFVRAPDLLLPAAVLNAALSRACARRVLDEARLVMIQADAFRARRRVRPRALPRRAGLPGRAVPPPDQAREEPATSIRRGTRRLLSAAACRGDRDPGRPVRLPLEKRLIASQLGMTRETFSRTLATVGPARHPRRRRAASFWRTPPPRKPFPARSADRRPRAHHSTASEKELTMTSASVHQIRSAARALAVHDRLHGVLRRLDDLRDHRHPDQKGPRSFGHAVRAAGRHADPDRIADPSHPRDLVRPVRRTPRLLRHDAVGGGHDRAADVRL